MRPARPNRSFRAQDPEHLLDLRRDLRSIAHPTRSIPRGPQPVAQPFDMVGDRAVYPGSPQRLRQPVPVTGEGIRHMARQNRKELPLQATERRTLPAAGDHRRRWRSTPAAPRERRERRRHEQQGEPPLPPQGPAHHVRREVAAGGQERRQDACRSRLGARRDGERARRGGRGLITAGRRIEVAVAHFGQHEITGGVRDREKVNRLAPGDPPCIRRDADVGLRGIDAKPGRPLEGRLGPQRDVADAGDRDGRVDWLADPRGRGIHLELQTQFLTDHVRRRSRGRQRQHRNRDRVATQHVALFPAEERERDGERVLNGRRRNNQAAGRQGEHDLMRDVQIDPPPAHLPRERDAGRDGGGVSPHAFRRHQRQERLPAHALAELAGDPCRGDEVDLLARVHRVARHKHRERHAVSPP